MPLVIVCVPVKLLLAASCGTFVESRLSVTLPFVPPPVRSVPAVTPVIVPVPFEVAHTHVLPFHCRPCPLEQVVSKLSVTLPFVPPPAPRRHSADRSRRPGRSSQHDVHLRRMAGGGRLLAVQSERDGAVRYDR